MVAASCRAALWSGSSCCTRAQSSALCAACAASAAAFRALRRNLRVNDKKEYKMVLELLTLLKRLKKLPQCHEMPPTAYHRAQRGYRNLRRLKTAT